MTRRGAFPNSKGLITTDTKVEIINLSKGPTKQELERSQVVLNEPGNCLSDRAKRIESKISTEFIRTRGIKYEGFYLEAGEIKGRNSNSVAYAVLRAVARQFPEIRVPAPKLWAPGWDIDVYTGKPVPRSELTHNPVYKLPKPQNTPPTWGPLR